MSIIPALARYDSSLLKAVKNVRFSSSPKCLPINFSESYVIHESQCPLYLSKRYFCSLQYYNKYQYQLYLSKRSFCSLQYYNKYQYPLYLSKQFSSSLYCTNNKYQYQLYLSKQFSSILMNTHESQYLNVNHNPQNPPTFSTINSELYKNRFSDLYLQNLPKYVDINNNFNHIHSSNKNLNKNLKMDKKNNYFFSNGSRCFSTCKPTSYVPDTSMIERSFNKCKNSSKHSNFLIARYKSFNTCKTTSNFLIARYKSFNTCKTTSNFLIARYKNFNTCKTTSNFNHNFVLRRSFSTSCKLPSNLPNSVMVYRWTKPPVKRDAILRKGRVSAWQRIIERFKNPKSMAESKISLSQYGVFDIPYENTVPPGITGKPPATKLTTSFPDVKSYVTKDKTAYVIIHNEKIAHKIDSHVLPMTPEEMEKLRFDTGLISKDMVMQMKWLRDNDPMYIWDSTALANFFKVPVYLVNIKCPSTLIQRKAKKAYEKMLNSATKQDKINISLLNQLKREEMLMNPEFKNILKNKPVYSDNAENSFLNTNKKSISDHIQTITSVVNEDTNDLLKDNDKKMSIDF